MSDVIGRYRLREKAYMSRAPGGPHELLHPGEEVRFQGVPPAHLEAIDAAATAAALAAPPPPVDPIRSLPLHTPVLPGGAPADPAVEPSPPPPPPPPPPAAAAQAAPVFIDADGQPLRGIALTNAKRAYTKAQNAAATAPDATDLSNV